MCSNSDRDRDTEANVPYYSQKQLADKEQAVVVKHTESNRMGQHASDDIKDDAVPLVVHDATANEMV